jgi:hypothetical protein
MECAKTTLLLVTMEPQFARFAKGLVPVGDEAVDKADQVLRIWRLMPT